MGNTQPQVCNKRLKYDIDDKVMKQWLMDLYYKLGSKRTIVVLNEAIDIMQSYNGNSAASVIAEAVFDNLNKKETKLLKHHMENIK